MTSVSGSRIRRSGRGAREGDIVVVKVGGSTLGEGDSTVPDLIALQKQGLKPVVVHGGGKVISEWVRLQGIRPEFVRGLRKTDKPTLDVAIAVLCGLVNAQLVAEIAAAGGKAVGLAGVDGGMLKAEILDPELGMVGKIICTDATTITAVLEMGAIPVIAPAALNVNAEQPDGSDRILNINADTVAAAIAIELKAEKLILTIAAPGILEDVDDPQSLISYIDRAALAKLKAEGKLADGMLPKAAAIDAALANGVRRVHVISFKVADSLLLEVFTNEGTGTLVVSDIDALSPAEQGGELS